MRAFICLITALAAYMPIASLAQSEAQYKLREETPRTGTNIRKNLTEPINVAINLSYAELSAEEKKRVRGNYEVMPDADEPPFPKKGLRALIKPISQLQQKLLVEGPLSLIGLIDENGKVVEVKAIGSPSPEMTKFASSVMILTEFKPAVCAGQPCVMEFPFRMQFTTRR
ncbi:hypothetical protein [Undibacterium crateris]|uniref:hypothetical protein n=1 Tax=Undibacterium crateris TaxID=2528175 RepID=UPI001389ABF9|nr:hypothetical protein [Undibacterium crateris]NDI85540.1 hypothetical protein [Undibacterium crateris]